MRVYSFNDVVGNYSTVNIIKSSLVNGTFPQFSMMIGDSGTGKSTCAEIVSLYLNCKHTVNGNPCLVCDDCRNNVLTLQNKSTSMSVRKIDLSQKNEKQDVSEIISTIFRLDTGSEKSVFILEECHELSKSNQTSLLEEIDKIGDGVYVIMCTTKPRDMIEELRNRAIKFKFGHLKPSDSKVLLSRLTKGADLGSKLEGVILKHCKGVPRNLVNIVQFIQGNQFSYEDIVNFLGEVDVEDLRNLLMSITDAPSFYNYLNILVDDYTVDTLVHSLKSYLLELQFLNMKVGTVHASMSPKDKDLSNLLGKDVIYKIQCLVHDLPRDCEREDFCFTMLKARSFVLKHLKQQQLQPSEAKTGVIKSPTAKVSMELPELPDENPSKVHQESLLKRHQAEIESNATNIKLNKIDVTSFYNR